MTNYVTRLGIALTLALPHAAQAQDIMPPPVPTNIEVSCSSRSPNSLACGVNNIQPTCPRELTGGITGYAQVGEGTNEVAEPEVSAPRVSFMKPNVNLDPFTSWAVQGERPAIRLTIRPDRFSQAPLSNRSGARARSKKRIVAGAIAGAVGGFFAGGFLGAHIEGDRCDCDDPGVRGFLIGGPIGAVAGAIAGGKFLF